MKCTIEKSMHPTTISYIQKNGENIQRQQPRKRTTFKIFQSIVYVFENKWRLASARFHKQQKKETICIATQWFAFVDNAFNFSHLCCDDNDFIVFFGVVVVVAAVVVIFSGIKSIKEKRQNKLPIIIILENAYTRFVSNAHCACAHLSMFDKIMIDFANYSDRFRPKEIDKKNAYKHP